MVQRHAPLLLIAVVLGVFFDYFFYGKALGISVLAYTLLALGGAAFLAYRYKVRPDKTITLLVPLTLFFASMVFVRASGLLTFFNAILVLYLSLLIVHLSMRPQEKLTQFNVANYFSRTGVLAPRFLKVAYWQFHELTSSLLNNHQKSMYKPYLRGIALSLPFLILFLILFSSADLVFRKHVGSLFDINLNGEVVFRLAIVLFIASLFTGAYTMIFTRPKTEDSDAIASKPHKAHLGATEATVILSSVGLLFLSFVLIQLAYFFGGAEHVATAGFKYSDYARRGFFELIAVAVVSMALIWVIKKSVHHETSKQRLVFKWLSAILIVQVLVIMVSAHMRLSLYEEAYGFTVLRLISHLFLAWLAVTLLLLISFIIREEREEAFALRLFISVMAFFALLNLINPHGFIARQNIERFEQTGKIDLHYLGSLSEDATPAVAGLLEHKEARIQQGAARILANQRANTEGQYTDWQSANLARQRAQHTFQRYGTQLDANESNY